MKDAKFRAWDEEMEEFFYSDKPDDIHFFEFKDGKLMGFAIREPVASSDPMEPPEPYCDEYPPMQSTGRKDREGTEIYDKDIVKLCYGIPPTYDTLVIEYADDETVGDISVSGWWMRNIRPNGVSGSLCKTYENDLEVIGNTIDNPEIIPEGE